MVENDVDVMCLVHITGDGGRPLTPFSASVLQRAVASFTDGAFRHAPFVAEIVYDDSAEDVALGVMIIHRTELRTRAVTKGTEGRWLHIEFAGRDATSVHIIGAYGKPGPFTSLSPTNQARHLRLLKEVVPRLRYLAKPSKSRPPGCVCGDARQGVPILLMDGNSVFRENDRPKGWDRGSNGVVVLAAGRRSLWHEWS